jgi:diketogulonate reductase-like aldo/keto reductase
LPPGNSQNYANGRIISRWWYRTAVLPRSHGTNIIYQGFSLLTANREIPVNPQVQRIARRLGATPAQIIFRFAMQVGMVPLTGTTSQQHMREDLEAERLTLSGDEIELIETIAV